MNPTVKSKIIDHIINFNDKKLSVSMIFNISLSGSVLLQSLIDSHPEILMIPITYPIYYTWLINKYKINLQDTNEVTKILLPFESPSILHNLGPNRDEAADLKIPETIELLKEILPELPDRNIKSFLLAYHFAYAEIFNIDISKIKTIVIHHHTPLCNHSFNSLNRNFNFEKEENNLLLQEALEAFPDLKMIYTIRNPYDSYNSLFNFLLNYDPKNQSCFNIENYFKYIVQVSFLYLHLLEMTSKYSNQVKIVYFEKLHLETVKTMEDLAKFLGINYDESLLKSTVMGKLWWGTNPNKVINGTNPSMVTDKWKKDLKTKEKKFCNQLYNPIITLLGYQKEDIEGIQRNISNVYFVEGELLSWLRFNNGIYATLFLLFGWIIMPSFWKKTYKEFWNYSKFWLCYPFSKIKFVNCYLSRLKDTEEIL